MKRVFSILICAVLLASLPAAPASAETDLSAYSISNGTVQASRFEDLTAPCSGTLLPFDWSAGDTVDAGDVLFQMMTTRVTAPVNGSVSALFVEEGDSADAAMATYGTVLAIEPEYISRMHASYLTAYENQDCLHVHVGQPLWFKFGSEEGTGIVISTADEYYEVEIHTGDYNIGRKKADR
jgi:multidrug resistance efflux pump